jgi:hypothetical protein
VDVEATDMRNRIVFVVALALLCGWAETRAAEEEQNQDDVSSFSDKFEVHGFGSLGYVGSTNNNYLTESLGGSLDFVEAAINAGFDITDDLRVGAQVFVGNLGEYGNYEPQLDWGYLDYRPKNWLGVRAGKFKRPLGFYNEVRDVDAARTFAMLPQSVYNVAYRDFFLAAMGASVYGNLELGSGGDLDYQVYYGLSDIQNDGSIAIQLADNGNMLMAGADNEFSPGFGFVWHTPLDGLRTGLTLTTFVTDIEADVNPFLQGLGVPPTTVLGIDAKSWVYSAEYTVGSWAFTGEYGWGGGSVDNPFFSQKLNNERYYGQATYRINSYFEVGSYYSVDRDSRDDREGENYDPPHSAFQKDLAACLRVDLLRYLIFKVEYHNVDGTLSVMKMANLDGREQKWQYLVTKVTFAF